MSDICEDTIKKTQDIQSIFFLTNIKNVNFSSCLYWCWLNFSKSKSEFRICSLSYEFFPPFFNTEIFSILSLVLVLPLKLICLLPTQILPQVLV